MSKLVDFFDDSRKRVFCRLGDHRMSTPNIFRRLTQPAAEVSVDVSRELASQEARIAAGLSAFVEVGDALLKIKEAKLYRQNYPSWETYLQNRWGMSDSQSTRLISASQICREIAGAGVTPPAIESHARELRSVPEGERAKVWAEITTEIPVDELTAEQIAEHVSAKVRKKPKRARHKKPANVKLRGKGWKITIERSTTSVDVVAALQEAIDQYQAKPRRHAA